MRDLILSLARDIIGPREVTESFVEIARKARWSCRGHPMLDRVSIKISASRGVASRDPSPRSLRPAFLDRVIGGRRAAVNSQIAAMMDDLLKCLHVGARPGKTGVSMTPHCRALRQKAALCFS